MVFGFSKEFVKYVYILFPNYVELAVYIMVKKASMLYIFVFLLTQAFCIRLFTVHRKAVTKESDKGIEITRYMLCLYLYKLASQVKVDQQTEKKQMGPIDVVIIYSFVYEIRLKLLRILSYYVLNSNPLTLS